MQSKYSTTGNDGFLNVHFFDGGGGDAIWIRFWGNDNHWHNVLVDGGYGQTYKYAFGPVIRHLTSQGESIDIWIISHIDRDHIGAALGFIQDKGIKDKSSAIKNFWFNHSKQTINVNTGKISVGDGIRLRQALEDLKIPIKQDITTELATTELFGLQLTILSPSPKKLAFASQLWQKVERTVKLGRRAQSADYGKTIEQLKQQQFTADTDPVNASSIALMLQYNDISFILPADSNPREIEKKLSSLGYTIVNPLHLSFMQLAHHGSKANTSPELLSLIRTNNYIITGNGITNYHPDKETLVRILINDTRGCNPICFHFACDTIELNQLFLIDEEPFKRYDFSCVFGGRVNNGVNFSY